MSAALLSLDDVPLARQGRPAFRCRAPPGKPRAAAASLHARSVERTLASRVWLGGSRCCRERYLVLAAAFWEMTYFGSSTSASARAVPRRRRAVWWGRTCPASVLEPPRTV
ncbi:MAG: hypothetical protein ACLSVD_06585 [Eggerthellaceae bacterium]